MNSGNQSQNRRGGSNSRGGGQNRRGGRSGFNNRQGQQEKPKKESILDLSKYMDKKILVKFNAGREVVGILKGYDQLQNMVLDEAVETLLDIHDRTRLTDETRSLGRTVCRGTNIIAIAPYDGTQEIANPFEQ